MPYTALSKSWRVGVLDGYYLSHNDIVVIYISFNTIGSKADVGTILMNRL